MEEDEEEDDQDCLAEPDYQVASRLKVTLLHSSLTLCGQMFQWAVGLFFCRRSREKPGGQLHESRIIINLRDRIGQKTKQNVTQTSSNTSSESTGWLVLHTWKTDCIVDHSAQIFGSSKQVENSCVPVCHINVGLYCCSKLYCCTMTSTYYVSLYTLLGYT